MSLVVLCPPFDRLLASRYGRRTSQDLLLDWVENFPESHHGPIWLRAFETSYLKTFVKHLYNLALLNQGMLKGSDLTSFINKSIEFLQK